MGIYIKTIRCYQRLSSELTFTVLLKYAVARRLISSSQVKISSIQVVQLLQHAPQVFGSFCISYWYVNAALLAVFVCLEEGVSQQRLLSDFNSKCP